MKKQRENTKGKEEQPRDYDIIGAVRAVNRRTPALDAIKVFRLTLAQADDLHEHLAARDRLARGGWPKLTPYERHSVYGDDYSGTRHRTLRIIIQHYNNESVTVCSA